MLFSFDDRSLTSVEGASNVVNSLVYFHFGYQQKNVARGPKVCLTCPPEMGWEGVY